MWIRRSFRDDALYTTVVQSYIDTLLRNGFNFECFIEGSRSRTGKLLSPKFGILSFLLDSVLSGRVDDAIICPVSTQYDKVIETEYSVSLLASTAILLISFQILYQRVTWPAQAEGEPDGFSFLVLGSFTQAWAS